MNLSQPYYIEKRNGPAHLDLAGEWEFACTDAPTDPAEIDWTMKAQVPGTVYWQLYEAGVLPHPYEKNNSKLYAWVDNKVWYYRRKFTVEEDRRADRAFLCLDGCAYYTRLFLNGELLGEHEGMFGGPYAEVAKKLRYGGENELVVEVKACDYGYAPDKWDSHNPDLSVKNFPIIPWNLARDKYSTPGDFIAIGPWGDIRIEFLPAYHLSRPVFFTESIDGNDVRVRFEVEISDPDVNELKALLCCTNQDMTLQFGLSFGTPDIRKDRRFEIRVRLTDRETGAIVYDESETYSPPDWMSSGISYEYFENHFYRRSILLENAKLWQPVGLGTPALYDAEITLTDENGVLLDTQRLSYGARIIEREYTAGEKLRARWGRYAFKVNGKPIFLTGLNWMPLDFFLRLPYEEYRWTLEQARDAGVQLLRVWNGGGIQETETFYDLCDELGIMVWQDGFPANNLTSNWDHSVLLNQAAMNLYRMRRHPSLAILCGGNEFNPYAADNLSSMAVMEELAEDLAPGVGFIRTTPDRGSAHIYTDMEPTCYRQLYRQIPFLGESGVHAFPCYKSLRQQISEEEFNRPLSDIFTEEFERKNPELRNHFCEFIPSRIPRMLSRASAITDIDGISLEDLCEATQMASYEFYEIMIQAMRENYPVTGGLMPWVYRRPSVAVGIQIMDGLGDPLAPYYALKEAYKPLTAIVSLPYVTWAAGEDVPLTVRVVNGAGERGARTLIVRLYGPDLSEICSQTRGIALDGEYQTVFDFPAFRLPEDFREKFFFVEASLYGDDALCARSFYWPKVLAAMDDPDFRTARRTGPQPNLMFEKGPWLKRQIEEGPGTRLTASVDGCQREGCRLSFRLTVKNDGPVPAFPVRPDTVDDGTVCAMEDSYFFLRPGEERVLKGDVLLRDNAPEVPTLRLTAWNTPTVELLLRY